MLESTRTAASSLDREHLVHFKRAVDNVLATELAEHIYAQILDGLPTIECWQTYLVPMRNHPVYQLNHTAVCPAVLDRIRQFRSAFDAGQLRFRQQLLQAFNGAPVGSHAFDLRLIEMTAVACHAIAAHLYQLDAGAHKHSLHRDWFNSEMQAQVLSQRYQYSVTLPTVPFRHGSYTNVEQYPDGEADMVGYWAEFMILGGVVVFDRGESDMECKAVYFHDGRLNGPMTLYPPTAEQFEALMAFLKAESPPLGQKKKDDDSGGGGGGGPLPILASKRNRYRWDPYLALRDHHIFRDRYERHNSQSSGSTWRWGSVHWPELGDQHLLRLNTILRARGEPAPDDESVRAAQEGLKQITPTSPLWPLERYGAEGAGAVGQSTPGLGAGAQVKHG